MQGTTAQLDHVLPDREEGEGRENSVQLGILADVEEHCHIIFLEQ